MHKNNFIAADREIVSSRTFNFDREKVFNAWSESSKIAKWWGPHGFTNTIHKFEFVPGGKWIFVMHGPDGKNYDNEIVFHEIKKPELIVLEHLPNPHFFVRVSFDDLGGRTQLTFRQLFDDAKTCQAIKKICTDGNEQNFDRLESLLSEGFKNDPFNPKLDLILERTVDIPPNLIWEGWTNPDILPKWFCPRPWTVKSCEIDLRPGGAFNFLMCSPEGQEFPNQGSLLEIIPNKKLVFTNALLPDFRPVDVLKSGADLFFTGIILLEPTGKGTKYTAIGRHRNEEDKKKHEDMGFEKGWSICLDQLLELMKKKKA